MTGGKGKQAGSRRERTFVDAMRDAAQKNDDGLIWPGGILEPKKKVKHGPSAGRRAVPRRAADPVTRAISEITDSLNKVYETRTKGGLKQLLAIPMLLIWQIVDGAMHDRYNIESLLDVRMLYVVLPVITLVVVFIFWSQRDRAEHLAGLGKQEGVELVLGRLCGGETGIGRIRGWIPRPLCWFYVPRNLDSLKEQVGMLARNFDWYMKPPKRLVRLHWIIDPPSMVIFIVFLSLLIKSISFLRFTQLPLDEAAHISLLIATAFMLLVLRLLAWHSRMLEGERVAIFRGFMQARLKKLSTAAADENDA